MSRSTSYTTSARFGALREIGRVEDEKRIKAGVFGEPLFVSKRHSFIG